MTNAAGPPPGEWLDWGPDEWHRAPDTNMLAPIGLFRLVLPGMRRRKWGRVVNITSAAVTAPLPLLACRTVPGRG